MLFNLLCNAYPDTVFEKYPKKSRKANYNHLNFRFIHLNFGAKSVIFLGVQNTNHVSDFLVFSAQKNSWMIQFIPLVKGENVSLIRLTHAVQ